MSSTSAKTEELEETFTSGGGGVQTIGEIQEAPMEEGVIATEQVVNIRGKD